MQVAELVALRDKSGTRGVISLGDASFMEFAGGPSPRPFSLIIFANAPKLKESANVRLNELLENFKLLASHVQRASRRAEYKDATNKVFFVEVDVMQERELAQKRLGVQAVPFVVHLAPANLLTCAPPGPAVPPSPPHARGLPARGAQGRWQMRGVLAPVSHLRAPPRCSGRRAALR
jgi:OST3 / OST6 family, transporter family